MLSVYDLVFYCPFGAIEAKVDVRLCIKAVKLALRVAVLRSTDDFKTYDTKTSPLLLDSVLCLTFLLFRISSRQRLLIHHSTGRQLTALSLSVRC